MVHGVIGDILPLALAVTISPIPIVAEILLLFTTKPVANAAAYLIGFVVGVAAVLSVLVAVGGHVDLYELRTLPRCRGAPDGPGRRPRSSPRSPLPGSTRARGGRPGAQVDGRDHRVQHRAGPSVSGWSWARSTPRTSS